MYMEPVDLCTAYYTGHKPLRPHAVANMYDVSAQGTNASGSVGRRVETVNQGNVHAVE